MRSTGIFNGTDANNEWTVVPGSGTDELQGVHGDGTAVAGHDMNGSLMFEYELA